MWRYNMAAKDYLDSEVAVAVAVTAAVFSPRVRGVLRRGAVYGVAGALMAGDAISAAAQKAVFAAQQAADSAPNAVEDTTEQATGGTMAGTNSPAVALRRSAVNGLARVLMAGDAISAAAREVGRGVQQVAASAADVVQDATEQAKAGKEGGTDTDAPEETA
jgi:hypothetical protein